MRTSYTIGRLALVALAALAAAACTGPTSSSFVPAASGYSAAVSGATAQSTPTKKKKGIAGIAGGGVTDGGTPGQF